MGRSLISIVKLDLLSFTCFSCVADPCREADSQGTGLDTVRPCHVSGGLLHFISHLALIPHRQDSFYKEHSSEELELAFANKYDFDHPDALDLHMFASVSVTFSGLQEQVHG